MNFNTLQTVQRFQNLLRPFRQFGKCTSLCHYIKGFKCNQAKLPVIVGNAHKSIDNPIIEYPNFINLIEKLFVTINSTANNHQTRHYVIQRKTSSKEKTKKVAYATKTCQKLIQFKKKTKHKTFSHSVFDKHVLLLKRNSTSKDNTAVSKKPMIPNSLKNLMLKRVTNLLLTPNSFHREHELLSAARHEPSVRLTSSWAFTKYTKNRRSSLQAQKLSSKQETVEKAPKTDLQGSEQNKPNSQLIIRQNVDLIPLTHVKEIEDSIPTVNALTKDEIQKQKITTKSLETNAPPKGEEPVRPSQKKVINNKTSKPVNSKTSQRSGIHSMNPYTSNVSVTNAIISKINESKNRSANIKFPSRHSAVSSPRKLNIDTLVRKEFKREEKLSDSDLTKLITVSNRSKVFETANNLEVNSKEILRNFAKSQSQKLVEHRRHQDTEIKQNQWKTLPTRCQYVTDASNQFKTFTETKKVTNTSLSVLSGDKLGSNSILAKEKTKPCFGGKHSSTWSKTHQSNKFTIKHDCKKFSLLHWRQKKCGRDDKQSCMIKDHSRVNKQQEQSCPRCQNPTPCCPPPNPCDLPALTPKKKNDKLSSWHNQSGDVMQYGLTPKHKEEEALKGRCCPSPDPCSPPPLTPVKKKRYSTSACNPGKTLSNVSPPLPSPKPDDVVELLTMVVPVTKGIPSSGVQNRSSSEKSNLSNSNTKIPPVPSHETTELGNDQWLSKFKFTFPRRLKNIRSISALNLTEESNVKTKSEPTHPLRNLMQYGLVPKKKSQKNEIKDTKNDLLSLDPSKSYNTYFRKILSFEDISTSGKTRPKKRRSFLKIPAYSKSNPDLSTMKSNNLKNGTSKTPIKELTNIDDVIKKLTTKHPRIYDRKLNIDGIFETARDDPPAISPAFTEKVLKRTEVAHPIPQTIPTNRRPVVIKALVGQSNKVEKSTGSNPSLSVTSWRSVSAPSLNSFNVNLCICRYISSKPKDNNLITSKSEIIIRKDTLCKGGDFELRENYASNCNCNTKPPNKPKPDKENQFGLRPAKLTKKESDRLGTCSACTSQKPKERTDPKCRNRTSGSVIQINIKAQMEQSKSGNIHAVTTCELDCHYCSKLLIQKPRNFK
ncbi:uncharacterized protein LOC108734824 [Agrilus planipennis]|uniref:Uncharacterized protein LOC108734824 n=1 Tax=Agrilus planipennis TaxID=224129 RepID=A0A1W4WPQ4_AGRPL|nr:uncharacterized protein LOC108734824 [Agrilus planipennis]